MEKRRERGGLLRYLFNQGDRTGEGREHGRKGDGKGTRSNHIAERQ